MSRPTSRPRWVIRSPASLTCTRCRAVADPEAPETAPMRFYARHARCALPAAALGRVASAEDPAEPLIDRGLTANHNPHAPGRGLPATGGFGRSRSGRRL